MFLRIVNSGRKELRSVGFPMKPTNPRNKHYNNQPTLDDYYRTYGTASGYGAVVANYQHASNKLILSKIDEENKLILSKIDELYNILKEIKIICINS